MTTLEQLLEQEAASVADLIRVRAEARPRQIAFIEGERSLDAAGLDELMDRIAAGLQRDGVQPGDNIAIAAATSIEYGAVYLAASRAGAAVAPLAVGSTAEALAAMLTDCAVTHLFLDDGVSRALAPVLRDHPARRIGLDGAHGAIPFADWLPAPGARPAPVPFDPDRPFNIIYSSGTTGTPRGIVHSHQLRWAQTRRGPLFGYGEQTVNLISTPLYSNTTLVAFLPGVCLGGTTVLMPRFEPAGFLALAERHRATHAMLVPVQYRRLLEHPDFDRTDLSAFRMKFCTSAPFAAELKAETLRRWPGGLVEFFGMTEGGGSTMLLAHLHPDKLHTVGVPLPGHEIRVLDDDGQPVAPGQVGEIVGQSPTIMMLGYHNQPAQTEAAQWIDPTGKRFIRTGDLGRLDEEGFLTVIGRKKDLIISGGFNVYPIDLETALLTHPAVAEAAVVGVPSDRWGETPVAFVVLAADRQADPEELRAWANERLGKTQRIADLELVDVLPRSAIGKVLKRELRDRYRPKPSRPEARS